MFDKEGKPSHVLLDTLHRKVIWALLAMYSVVFIGFSMEDPFFMKMIEIVKDDLKLYGDKLHKAVLPTTDKDKTLVLPENYCVQPIFYPVPELTNPGAQSDHGGLKKLLFEIANKIGVPVGSSSISEITKKMLER